MTALACLLVLIFIFTGLVAVAVAITRGSGRSNGGRPSEDDGGGGGSVRGRPPKPRNPVSPTDPPWWPQFERDFAAYVTRRGSRLPVTPRDG